MNKKYAMAYIIDRCVDCKACMVACKAEWEVPEDYFRTHIDHGEKEEFHGKFRKDFLPSQCNHCDQAPCVTVCPTKASHKREDGIVYINRSRCVGCKYCIPSCPYDARFFNHDVGVAEKCTFCLPRLAEGKEPACATTCPGNVRVFGDLNDPNSEISVVLREAKDNRLKVWKLREDLGTMPNIYYIQS